MRHDLFKGAEDKEVNKQIKIFALVEVIVGKTNNNQNINVQRKYTIL